MMFDAVILAGGAGRRLGGVDKAAIEVGGISTLQRALGAVTAAQRVVVVGPRRPAPERVIWTREDPPGSGPAAAIAAGMKATSATTFVVLAVDMPFVDSSIVQDLVGRVEGGDGAMLVDEEGRPQPLAAAYDRIALERRFAVLGEPAGASVRELIEGLDLRSVAGGRAATDLDTWDDVTKADQGRRSC
jgi:molybdopterin-guanine dinucleotide biosynthesis protein A